jgi:multidrug resistance efflux pump
VLQDAVPPGSKVAKGQVVAEFDRQYMLLRLDDYRDSVSESEAALTTQTANLDTTRKAHQQMILTAKGALDKARLDMKTIPVLSAIDAERTRLAFDEAQARYQQLLREVPYLKASQDADIRNSELDLEESKLELKRAAANAERMVVRAPVNGLAVMETTWRGGEFGKIQKGDQVWAGQPFMKVVDTSSMLVSATVNQVDVEKVRLGAKARVKFDAYPDLQLTAHVESIGAMTMEAGQRENFVRQIPVRLRIEFPDGKPDPRVIPDLTVSADVEVSPPVRSETVVPRGAIFRAGNGQPYVYVKERTGWSPRDVQVGAEDYLVAAIRSGLSAGDVVALDPPPSGVDR